MNDKEIKKLWVDWARGQKEIHSLVTSDGAMECRCPICPEGGVSSKTQLAVRRIKDKLGLTSTAHIDTCLREVIVRFYI